jgi:hypothetical protein
MSVAIIGTSSGPGRAAICRERKPDLLAASNNFLEVADNFLDFARAIRFEMRNERGVSCRRLDMVAVRNSHQSDKIGIITQEFLINVR